MPIDPTGTSPQPVQDEEKVPTVNMKCKNCPSITAEEVKIPGHSARVYRCVQCKHTSSVNVGGFFPY